MPEAQVSLGQNRLRLKLPYTYSDFVPPRMIDEEVGMSFSQRDIAEFCSL